MVISLLMIIILLQWSHQSFVVSHFVAMVAFVFIVLHHLAFYHYACIGFCCNYLFMFARPHPLICYCGCIDICCSYFAIKKHLCCPPFYCCGCLGLHYSYIFMFARPSSLCHCGCLGFRCNYLVIKNHFCCPPFRHYGCFDICCKYPFIFIGIAPFLIM